MKCNSALSRYEAKKIKRLKHYAIEKQVVGYID